jgi:hypothetical protein
LTYYKVPGGELVAVLAAVNSLLGLRSTRNPNVARRHNQELTGRQLVRVLFQRLIQMLNLGLQLDPWKPEKRRLCWYILG